MAPNAPTPGNTQLQLRDVVVTLQRQNSMLSDVVQNTQGTENQLNAFIAYLQRRDQQDHLEETERAAAGLHRFSGPVRHGAAACRGLSCLRLVDNCFRPCGSIVRYDGGV